MAQQIARRLSGILPVWFWQRSVPRRVSTVVMNRKLIIRSIIIALLLALVLTVIGDFLFTRRASYSMKADEWQKMDSMNYKDAMEYMNQHKTEVSPVRNFLEKYRDIDLLKIKFKLFCLHFVGIFLGCLLLATLQNRDKKT